MKLVFRVSGVTGRPAREIRATLRELGLEAAIVNTLVSYELNDDDIIIAVGDDRTILRTLYELGSRANPVLGVSEDPIRGFLSQVTIEQLKDSVQAIIKGRRSLEESTRLAVVVDSDSPIPAVNEVAVFPKRSATLMEYTLSVDDEIMWRDYADGIIVATPLGSSAYSLSAGGSLIHHNARVFEVVPVNSVDMTRRSLIVPEESKIVIDGVSSRVGVEVVVDGFIRRQVKERIVVSKHSVPCRFVRLNGPSPILSKLEKKVYLAEELLKIPPSAKLIMKILEYEGPLTYRELMRRTMLPDRTIRHALNVLLSKKIIIKKPLPRDARQKLYYLSSYIGGAGSNKQATTLNVV